jgi:RNA polymerase sigma factor (sigma-70 family)
MTASSLFAEHKTFVLSIARKIARQAPRFIDPDELFAAGLVGLWHACQRFCAASGCSFKSYAFSRIRGAIYDWLRDAYQGRRLWLSRAGGPPIPLSQLESPLCPLEFVAPRSEEFVKQVDEADLVRFALRALGCRHRRVVQLFYFEYHSTLAIAQRLKCAESSVFRLLCEARARMRSFLALSEKKHERTEHADRNAPSPARA